MSNIIEFRRTIVDSDKTHGVATLDGATNLITPLQLPMNGTSKMQVCSVMISDLIPNVFNANPVYQFNNTLCRVSTDHFPGLPAYDIQLPAGRYATVIEIADGINSAISTNVFWWLNPLDPGIIFSANPITNTVTIILDGTKLAPAFGTEIRLDLRKTTTGTDLATTLGFSQGTAYMLSGLGARTWFYSNQEVKMDTQGTACDIQSSLVNTRFRNDTAVRTLAMVPFAGKLSISDNIWPSSGQISPVLVYQGDKNIKYWKIEVKTLEGKPMLFMGGVLHVVVAFIY